MRALAALAALAAQLVGCGHVTPTGYVDRRVAEPVAGAQPPLSPAPLRAGPAAGAQGPGARLPLPSGEGAWGEGAAPPLRLAQLLDLALSSDPATRAAWLDARAAAATAGARRAAWLPTLDAAGALQQVNATQNTRPGVKPLGATASARLSWLLVDLGARGAAADEAELNLTAARLAHEVAGQDLALQVEVAWFSYQASRALAVASQASLQAAQASLDAAEARQRVGAATVTDVLQARTARSQAQLEAQRVDGQALVLRGTLASLAGLPPSAPLEAAPLPAELPRDLALAEVAELLEEAARRNPDLARARAQAAAAEARATAAGLARLPSLSFSSAAARLWPVRPEAGSADSWSWGLTLDVPLFDGQRTSFEAAAAREAAGAARARAEQAERKVRLDAWTALQGVRTAARRVETARDLLSSATTGADATAARYREGLGSILDVLTAQGALAAARAEEILARTDWLVSVARLARAAGRALPLPDGAP